VNRQFGVKKLLRVALGTRCAQVTWYCACAVTVPGEGYVIRLSHTTRERIIKGWLQLVCALDMQSLIHQTSPRSKGRMSRSQKHEMYSANVIG